MNRLKKSITVILWQLIMIYGVAQNTNLKNNENARNISEYILLIEIDRNEYALGEDIHIKFKIDFKEDSLQYSKFEGFNVRVGPITSNQTRALAGGAIERSKTIQYILNSTDSGEYIIESPIFFIDGKEIKGWEKITVLDTLLTKREENKAIANVFEDAPNQTEKRHKLLSNSQSKIDACTWVGQNKEYLNISKKIATLQKGRQYSEFDMVKYVKNKYFILSQTNHGVEFKTKYNIVSITQDTLILAPEGRDFFDLGEANKQNQYVFVNSMLIYKFVKLHFETSLSNEDAEKSRVTLDIDSAKRSKVTVKDMYSNETKVYRSPVTKKDYERLMKILSSYDLSSFPDENIMFDSIKCHYSILEIHFNDQKKLFKGCFAVPKNYLKLGDFMWEYVMLRTGLDIIRVRKVRL
ncbi:MAG: BatD family protein [Lentimicrobiaceae bacterium]|nr:BatD family protein [Lentimicrobiaceae bacterium]